MYNEHASHDVVQCRDRGIGRQSPQCRRNSNKGRAGDEFATIDHRATAPSRDSGEPCATDDNRNEATLPQRLFEAINISAAASVSPAARAIVWVCWNARTVGRFLRLIWASSSAREGSLPLPA